MYTKKTMAVLGVICAAAIAATGALAAQPDAKPPKPKAKNFLAKLRGANERPTAVESDGVGTGKLMLKKDGVHFFLNAANIDKVTAAHVHCGTANDTDPGAGDTSVGPVVATLFSDGAGIAPSGRFAQGVITNATVFPDGTCPVGWTGDDGDRKVENFDEFVALLRSGNAYVNVHTTDFPNGELRGQLRRLGPKA
jgi:hypothetical protein